MYDIEPYVDQARSAGFEYEEEVLRALIERARELKVMMECYEREFGRDVLSHDAVVMDDIVSDIEARLMKLDEELHEEATRLMYGGRHE